MIYISSNCIKKDYLCDAVEALAEAGFKNIELSYGGKYDEGYEKDMIALKEKYGLDYCCHNYFIPSKDSFVVNLASLKDEVYCRSLEYLKGAISLTKKLGSKKYSFHAGFLVDINCEEIGREFARRSLYNKPDAIGRFCEGFAVLSKVAGESGIELYIENNVFSLNNSSCFNGENPFLLTGYQDYLELKKYIDCKLLLDVAHLKVSCNSLATDYEEELFRMLNISDYLHISDNDGGADLHQPINQHHLLFEIMKARDNNIRTLTLEVKGIMKDIMRSYEIIKECLYSNKEQ